MQQVTAGQPSTLAKEGVNPMLKAVDVLDKVPYVSITLHWLKRGGIQELRCQVGSFQGA